MTVGMNHGVQCSCDCYREAGTSQRECTDRSRLDYSTLIVTVPGVDMPLRVNVYWNV